MINEFVYQDNIIETKAEPAGGMTQVTVGGKLYKIYCLSPGKYQVEVNGVKTVAGCVVKNNKSFVDIDGILLELTIPSEDNGGAGGVGAGVGEKDKIYAPMPGKVVKLLVGEGDEVKEKQHLVIVEAMKMENPVMALADGTVKKVNFADGDQVDTETPIIELEIE